MKKILNFVILLLFLTGCSSDDSTTNTEIEAQLPALKSTQTNMFFGAPADWYMEFAEDGRPTSTEDYSFSYDANNQLIENININFSGGTDYSETRRYEYENGQLNRFDFTSFLSSDGIGWIFGDIAIDGRVVEHQIFDGSRVYRYTFLDEDYRYLEMIERFNFNSSDEPIERYEYEYDDQMRMIACKEYGIHAVSNELVFRATYNITYDDKNNPLHLAFKDHDPLVFGLITFRRDRSTLYFLESHLRRNMANNVTSIEREYLSGNTYSWDYEYTYTSDDLPLTRRRVLDGTITDEVIYDYYEIP